MSRSILVPFDGSTMAERALEYALSAFEDPAVTVLYVVDYVEESYGARTLVGTAELMARAEERAEAHFETARATAADHDASIETETAVGRPDREILAYADEHDVDGIVIGSHGRDVLSRALLGSVADPVVRRAPVPVTVVR